MPYNFNSNMHAYGNRQTHSHIAHTPLWFFPVRVLQGILAFVTLALSAFVIDAFGYGYDVLGWHGLGMNIFTSIFTFIFLVYVFLTAFKFVHAYNIWAVLGFEIALVIFWLVTFALLADHAKEGNAIEEIIEEDNDLNQKGKNAINSLTAVAVLSAINFVLFVATLIFFSVSFHRHRVEGHPFTAGGTTSTGDHKLQNVNPATGTQQHSGTLPVGNQPVYNQQGHQAV